MAESGSELEETGFLVGFSYSEFRDHRDCFSFYLDFDLDFFLVCCSVESLSSVEAGASDCIGHSSSL